VYVDFTLTFSSFAANKLFTFNKSVVWFLLIWLLLTAVIKLLRSAREKYGSLEIGNIPVVPPTLFLGSEPDLHLQVPFLEDIKRFKIYGGFGV